MVFSKLKIGPHSGLCFAAKFVQIVLCVCTPRRFVFTFSRSLCCIGTKATLRRKQRNLKLCYMVLLSCLLLCLGSLNMLLILHKFVALIYNWIEYRKQIRLFSLPNRVCSLRLKTIFAREIRFVYASCRSYSIVSFSIQPDAERFETSFSLYSLYSKRTISICIFAAKRGKSNLNLRWQEGRKALCKITDALARKPKWTVWATSWL